jgi:UDP-glucose 6-dehydrogenase
MNRNFPGKYDLVLTTQKEILDVDHYNRVMMKMQEQDNLFMEAIEKCLQEMNTRKGAILRPLVKALAFNTEKRQQCLTRASAIIITVRRRDNAVRAYRPKRRSEMHTSMYRSVLHRASKRLVKGERVTALSQKERRSSTVKRARQSVREGSTSSSSSESESCDERTTSEESDNN